MLAYFIEPYSGPKLESFFVKEAYFTLKKSPSLAKSLYRLLLLGENDKFYPVHSGRHSTQTPPKQTNKQRTTFCFIKV